MRCERCASSKRQTAPSCVHKTAASSAIATAQVNTASLSSPSKTFRPANVLGTGLALERSVTVSRVRRHFAGDEGGSNLQTLTWRVPTVITVAPIQAMVSAVVHRLDEFSFNAPVFGLMDHKKRPPSWRSPTEHSHFESEENAMAWTPNVCSVRHATGMSGEALVAVEKTRIRGW